MVDPVVRSGDGPLVVEARNSCLPSSSQQQQQQQQQQRPLKKRRRDATATTITTTTTEPSQSSERITNTPTPAQLLQTLLLEQQRHDGNDKTQPPNITFSPPTQQEIANYTLAAVQAVRVGDLQTLETLAKANSLNACNQFGESLLHLACRRGHVPVIRLLLASIGTVAFDKRDDFGRTCAHDALWTSLPRTDVVQELLNHGLPLSFLLIPDVRGHTCFDYARKEHYPVWCAFLRAQFAAAAGTRTAPPPAQPKPTMSMSTTTAQQSQPQPTTTTAQQSQPPQPDGGLATSG